MPHILLVEPNTLLAQTYRSALQGAGYEVAHEPRAQGAVLAADVRKPDLVVLELQLPDHGGIEFLHEFRSYAEWQRVPVVICTLLHPSRLAFGREALRRDLGVKTVLYKPQTSLAELLRAVQAELVAA